MGFPYKNGELNFRLALNRSGTPRSNYFLKETLIAGSTIETVLDSPSMVKNNVKIQKLNNNRFPDIRKTIKLYNYEIRRN